MRRECTPATIVINASNLHGGGGVQVAISFLHDVIGLQHRDLRLRVLASSEVADGLKRLGVADSAFDEFEVINTYGVCRGASVLRKKLQNADAVFTIFGPLYLTPKPKLSIVGFAQSWIIYPNNEVYARLKLTARWRTRLEFFLKKYAFQSGSDAVFVEAEHVKNGLIAERIFDREQIAVIPNCISDLYLSPETWKPTELPARRAPFRLGVVSRDYPHKNLDMIPAVKLALRQNHDLDVDFVVTFNDEEWQRKSQSFKIMVLNAGPLHVEQCPLFYDQLDGVFFPSLLECFSATPLEAMIMGKPLFASDRSFVREFCGEFPWYFDPQSPENAARVIAEFLRSDGGQERIEAARQHVLSLPNSRDRAQSYLDSIRSLLATKKNRR